ncbi:MAG: PD-(D/E)XK nuclease family protein [Elusimicrobia bacterium]|nr:PD-(D/E)XK nuclease family protein [Elusimicrobiota bacterium]
MDEPRLEEDRSSKFSPSKLSVYQNCPRRYQYRYVDKISRRRKTPETVTGVAVHAAFEELYGLVTGGKVPSLAELQEIYEREFSAEWDGSVVEKDARFVQDDWRKVGRDCVQLYYEAHQPFSEDRTVAVEKRVGFPIMVDGHEYRIEGFVDRLALAPDGAFEIVDYKTAKSLPNQRHADEDWQLALYELAVRLEWPDTKEVRLKWHYVRHGKTLVSIRDDAARARLLADAAALISRIKHDHEFKTNRGTLCDWCEYRDLCPEFADEVRVAALPPAEREKDGGVKLVARYAEIEERRKRLKDELKAVEAEREKAEEDIADWAEAAGVAVVAGERAQASVSVKDEIHLPTKTGDAARHAELEAEARKTPLWAEVARLDGHALLDGLKARRWTGELLALAESFVARFGHRAHKRTVRLKRRADSEED